METAKIIIEYLKIILSAQVIIGVICITFFALFKTEIRSLLNRIASITIGSTVLSSPQPSSEINNSKEIESTEELELPEELQTDDPEIETALRQAMQAERARAHLWEYRYLNGFLVRNTQKVLDWLISNNSPPNNSMYDAWWNGLIATSSERQAIINVLEEHNLLILDGGLITVTPKGEEYAEWRGPLQDEK